MRSLIIDLQYLPVVDYYLSLLNSKHVIFDQYDDHRKMSYRNRCVIAGANGPINLTVPIVGGRDQKSPAFGLMIDNSVGWQKHHLKSIVSAYRRSPFFEYYSHGLSTLFERKVDNLLEWNLWCIDWLRSVIGGNWSFILSDLYQAKVDEEQVSDLRNHFTPRDPGINSPANLSYRQVFQERNGVVSGVSIVDFLFCAGPKAIADAAAKIQND